MTVPDRRTRALVPIIGVLWLSATAVLFRHGTIDGNGGRPAPPDHVATGGDARGLDGGSPATAPALCDIDPPDGHVAITAAIAACADGSTVRFPAGRVYHQNDAISVVGRRDLVIDGNGSTFISSAPNEHWASIYDARPNWRIVEGTRVHLRGLTIRGNLPPGPRGILPGNQYNAGITIYGGERIHVSDVSVFAVFGEFVVSNPSGFFHGLGALDGQIPRDVVIDRLYGEGAARQCVAVSAAEGFHLRDSTLRDCYQNGVDIEPDVAGERIRDVHIIRNSVRGYRFAAIVVPTSYGVGDVQGVEIRGNTTGASDSCYPAVLLGGVQKNQNLLYDIVVADNRLETLYEGVKATHVASGRVTGNQVTLRAARNLCGPPTAAPVRLIDSPDLGVDSTTASGYG